MHDHPATLAAAPRGRRLADRLLVPFHQACDQGDLEVAQALLRILEMMLRRPASPADADLRKNRESLVAAYERLWLLRHPEATGQ